ncbi:hypothetical protein [Paenibacillus tengchongensis]|uniref:hypothetical protein n=1 Tax=Paenibacillus tengchongensis TaxID=2608684 RepID=UPI00124C2F53|nr:hypothetical protein [Paenibacillus tengchongensis]
MKPIPLSIVILAAILALILSGCGHDEQTAGKEQAAEATPPVLAASATAAAVQQGEPGLEAGLNTPVPQVTHSLPEYRAKPPLPSVHAAEADVTVMQNSYCWDYLGCADYVGIPGMLDQVEPTTVQPGERLQILLDYSPAPTEELLYRWIDNGNYEQVPLSGQLFTAPEESGRYYYMYSANWMTDDGVYVLNQTSAVFSIEVP